MIWWNWKISLIGINNDLHKYNSDYSSLEFPYFDHYFGCHSTHPHPNTIYINNSYWTTNQSNCQMFATAIQHEFMGTKDKLFGKENDWRIFGGLTWPFDAENDENCHEAPDVHN